MDSGAVLKTVIDMVINKSFNPERIFGSGGMPSSHSATVCALTTASGMKYGVGSFEFAISFVLSMIVMYDAMGVRRETGKQAKLLNSVFFENILNLDGVFSPGKTERICGTYAATGSCGSGSWYPPGSAHW